MTSSIRILLLVSAFLFISFGLQHAHAQTSDSTLDQPTDIDEAFDPFSDYSEVEQDAEEEADINFFRNGRFLTLGLQLGYRGFTSGGMSQAYTPNLLYGVQFSYFFDFQIAGALGFVLGDHQVNFDALDGLGQPSQHFSGTVNIQEIDLNIKYYFNMKNVTRGLADLNPYMIFGMGHYIRTYNMDEGIDPSPDRVFGFKLGGGLEIPMMRRQAYLGVQFLYHLVQFPDEGAKTIVTGTDINTGLPTYAPINPTIDGDPYELSVILGVNF